MCRCFYTIAQVFLSLGFANIEGIFLIEDCYKNKAISSILLNNNGTKKASCECVRMIDKKKWNYLNILQL
jgi:hypothetical protein